jgi:hypothetical protein
LKSEFIKIFRDQNNNYKSKNKALYNIREKEKEISYNNENKNIKKYKNKNKNHFPTFIYKNKIYDSTRQTYFSFKSPNNNSNIDNILNGNEEEDNISKTFDSNSNTNNNSYCEEKEKVRNFINNNNNINIDSSVIERNNYDDKKSKFIFSDLDNMGKGHITYLRNRNSLILSDSERNFKDTLNDESRRLIISNNNNNKNIDVGKSLILPDIDLNNKLYKEKKKDLNKNSIKANNNNYSKSIPRNKKEKKSPYEIYKGNNKLRNSSETRFKNIYINTNKICKI